MKIMCVCVSELTLANKLTNKSRLTITALVYKLLAAHFEGSKKDSTDISILSKTKINFLDELQPVYDLSLWFFLFGFL